MDGRMPLMWILGIDTSSPKGSIALTLKDKIISERSLANKASFSKYLFSSLDSILQEVNLEISKIDAFAVSIGPGSFTGLRVGLSTALGLSLAQKKPVIPIETLYAMAHTIPVTEFVICPILDARKGEVYTSFFQYDNNKQLCQLVEDRAIKPEILINEIKKPTIFFGTGVDAYEGVLKKKLGHIAIFNQCYLNTVAGSAAILGGEKFEMGEGQRVSNQLKPKYIRHSEAEVRLARA